MLVLTHESRLASFRARVIAEQSGCAEVDSLCVLAGLIVSPEVIDVCRRLAVDPQDLIADLGLTASLDRMGEIERSLAEQGIAFISQEHVDSVFRNAHPPALCREALEIIRELERACTGPSDPITPVDLFFALVFKIPEFAHTASVRRLKGLKPRAQRG